MMRSILVMMTMLETLFRLMMISSNNPGLRVLGTMMAGINNRRQLRIMVGRMSRLGTLLPVPIMMANQILGTL